MSLPLQHASLLLWNAAFWVAMVCHARSGPRPGEVMRFGVGLLLGAILARAGWALLHPGAVAEHPWALLQASGGFCVLFLPLGLFVCAPPHARGEARARFLSRAVASLPLALATARLGCLLDGCCHGIPTLLPWGIPLPGGGAGLHPTPLYDILGLLLLHRVLRHTDDASRVAVFAVGFGALRLLVEPWRSAPPLGEPMVPVALVAMAWVVFGGVLWSRSRAARLRWGF